jgi:hypothetical protein
MLINGNENLTESIAGKTRWSLKLQIKWLGPSVRLLGKQRYTSGITNIDTGRVKPNTTLMRYAKVFYSRSVS